LSSNPSLKRTRQRAAAPLGFPFEPVISKYAEADVRLVDGLTHMGVVVAPAVQPVVKKWLEGIDSGGEISS